MSTATRYVTAAAAIFLWATTVCAQVDRPASGTPSRVTVTAAATADRVRFTAPSTVVQMRLEVYDGNGIKLFDNEIKGGNVIDWRLQNGQAEPLSDGAYLCVVTAKTLSGRITQRIASATVDKATATLQTAAASQLSRQQSEAVGPIEDDASLILLKEDEQETTTVISHNGEDGQITRGRGALSFRVGDFFRGKEVEQMRLSADGNLGIGVASPQAKLDVAGAIRASQGIIFPDGTIQFSAARRTFGAASRRGDQSLDNAEGEPHPSVSGTGTTGRITKWVDGPTGALADSVITELNGNIGINGAPSPIYKLDVNGHNRFRGSNVSFYLTGSKPTGNEWVFQTVDADGRLRVFDNTSGAEHFSLTQSGNLGLGTAAPTARIHVRANSGNVLIGDPGCNPGFGAIGFGASMSGCANYSLLGEGSHTYLNRPTGGSILFREGNLTQMTITPGGNVGIGTLTPVTQTGGRALHIEGPASALRLGSTQVNGSQWEWQSTTLGSVGAINLSNLTTFTNPLTVFADGRVGIRSLNPSSQFHINTPASSNPISAMTLDVQSFGNAGNAAASHFFRVRDVGSAASAFFIRGDGKVGIGTDTPEERLTVNGTIQTTAGGFKFPDGSVQTAAAFTASAASSGNNSTDTPIPILIGGISVFNHINVPPGHYLAVATLEVVNSANFLGQNNTRNVICSVSGGQDFSFDIAGLTRSTVSFHALSTVVETGASIKCRANVTGAGEVQITTRRLTVLRLDGSVSFQ